MCFPGLSKLPNPNQSSRIIDCILVIEYFSYYRWHILILSSVQVKNEKTKLNMSKYKIMHSILKRLQIRPNPDPWLQMLK